ncbi:hypothetical protein RI367_005929 [Sorochytrium milnesiophthora]
MSPDAPLEQLFDEELLSLSIFGHQSFQPQLAQQQPPLQPSQVSAAPSLYPRLHTHLTNVTADAIEHRHPSFQCGDPTCSRFGDKPLWMQEFASFYKPLAGAEVQAPAEQSALSTSSMMLDSVDMRAALHTDLQSTATMYGSAADAQLPSTPYSQQPVEPQTDWQMQLDTYLSLVSGGTSTPPTAPLPTANDQLCMDDGRIFPSWPGQVAHISTAVPVHNTLPQFPLDAQSLLSLPATNGSTHIQPPVQTLSALHDRKPGGDIEDAVGFNSIMSGVVPAPALPITFDQDTVSSVMDGGSSMLGSPMLSEFAMDTDFSSLLLPLSGDLGEAGGGGGGVEFDQLFDFCMPPAISPGTANIATQRGAPAPQGHVHPATRKRRTLSTTSSRASDTTAVAGDPTAMSSQSTITDAAAHSEHQVCSNCSVTRTPLWRRSTETDELLCNLHKQARPKSMHNAGKQVAEAPTYTCDNCETTKTSLWRRGENGQPLCNACALYYKLHKSHRPLKLRTGVVKKRTRQPKKSKLLTGPLPLESMAE